MSEPIGLQVLLRHHLPAYLAHHRLDAHTLAVCSHILHCRTEAMGGQQLRCDHCTHEVIHYHSCRDRHCPQCQQAAALRWSEREQTQLLPVRYFHLVFTLPHTLNGWVRLHPQSIYHLLFQSAWQTLRQFGHNSKRLQGELGMTAVLHTWGQNLSQHVHLHCLVPGGVLCEDASWHAAKGAYLFPVRALSRRFRGEMVNRLRQQFNAGELPRITAPTEPGQTLNQLMAREWVLYAKPCLEHTETVLNYLARYSHRGAISNRRILSIGEQIRLRYKDYAANAQHKVLCLAPNEFIRRLLQHILPKGFMRVRHYGFLANCCRKRKHTQLLAALAQQATEQPAQQQEAKEAEEGYPCPKCHQGRLRVSAVISPSYRQGETALAA